MTKYQRAQQLARIMQFTLTFVVIIFALIGFCDVLVALHAPVWFWLGIGPIYLVAMFFVLAIAMTFIGVDIIDALQNGVTKFFAKFFGR